MPWIAFTDSFLSIVADPVRKDTLIVRARASGDIERVFPDAKVQTIAGRDYAFRAYLPRNIVAGLIAARIIDTPETNFKGATVEKDRHDAYYRFWEAMARFQEDRGHGYPYATTATGRAKKRHPRRAKDDGLFDHLMVAPETADDSRFDDEDDPQNWAGSPWTGINRR